MGASGHAAGPGPTAEERRLLAAARRGDEVAYARLVEPHRRELHAHCYRMLGSLHDADDALQEALLRAWRGLARFEGRSSTRKWLYAIATNASLDVVARRPRRVLPLDHGPAAAPHDPPGEPFAESIWIEPYPEAMLESDDDAPEERYERRETVELAFVAALQHLQPRQRAVLILREVLGFAAAEVAAVLDTTVASVNSLLQRARRSVDEHLPEGSQQETLRQLGDARVDGLVARYMDALERADVGAIVSMLAEDATWSMPPMRAWYQGLDAIVPFLVEHPLTLRWRHLPTRASGQPAVGCYLWDGAAGRYDAAVLDVLTLRGDRIAHVTGFVTPALLPRFGLPPELPPR